MNETRWTDPIDGTEKGLLSVATKEDTIAAHDGMWLPGATIETGEDGITLATEGRVTGTTETRWAEALLQLSRNDSRNVPDRALECARNAGVWVSKVQDARRKKLWKRWGSAGVSPSAAQHCLERITGYVRQAPSHGGPAAANALDQMANAMKELGFEEAAGPLGTAKLTSIERIDEMTELREWTRNEAWCLVVRHHTGWISVVAPERTADNQPCFECVRRAFADGPWRSEGWIGLREPSPGATKTEEDKRGSGHERAWNAANLIARWWARDADNAAIEWWPDTEAGPRPIERVGADPGCETCRRKSEPEDRWWNNAGAGDSREVLEKLAQRAGPWIGPVAHHNERNASEVHDGRWGFCWVTTRAARPRTYGGIGNLPGIRLYAAGKGATRGGARYGALAETKERTAITWTDGAECVMQSTGALERAGRRYLHPQVLMQHSARQQSERDAINAQGLSYVYVPVTLDEHHHERPIGWIEALAVEEPGAKVLVPRSWTFMAAPQDIGERVRKPADGYFAKADTNGCAAGPTPSEALARAACEIVERHGFALWWYNRIPRPGVDLKSFNDPYLDEAQARMASIGRWLEVLDVSVHPGLPAMVAVSRRERPLIGGGTDPTFSAGCAASARLAARRAVSEHVQLGAEQLEPWASTYRGHDAPEFDTIQHWEPEGEPWLVPNAERDALRIGDYPPERERRDNEHLDHVRATLTEMGATLHALRYTTPSDPLPVVRAIVPELSHFWHRFGLERLRTEPKTLGWTETVLEEHELNPTPVTL